MALAAVGGSVLAGVVEVGAAGVDPPAGDVSASQNPPQAADPAWPDWGHHVWALATTELWLRERALGTRFSEWMEALALGPTQFETMVRPARSRS